MDTHDRDEGILLTTGNNFLQLPLCEVIKGFHRLLTAMLPVLRATHLYSYPS